MFGVRTRRQPDSLLRAIDSAIVREAGLDPVELNHVDDRFLAITVTAHGDA